MSVFTEESYENSIIQLFENMGWTHIYGPDVERDFSCPVFLNELFPALQKINP
ncbi:MAG: hypothetical protein HUK25_08335, partial [Treponema sp.]|nr:hypothetical protein [Treponema sp.]